MHVSTGVSGMLGFGPQLGSVFVTVVHQRLTTAGYTQLATNKCMTLKSGQIRQKASQ
jgi:hypothetical protein